MKTKKFLRILVLIGLLLALVPLNPAMPSLAQSYPGPYDLVVLENDAELIMESLAYIAAIHRLNSAPLPPILIYDGANTAELQDFYDDYGPFDEAVPVVLTIGTVPTAALPTPSMGGWTWTGWCNHSQAGGENIDRNGSLAWSRPHYTRYLNNTFASVWPQIAATDWLRATQFGFHYPWLVPADAQIGGVEAQIARDCTAGNKGKDDAVYLILGGVEQGSNQASSAWWPIAVNFEYETYAWDGGDLSAADVRNSAFGVQLSAMPTGEYGTLRVDHIHMRVQYSVPPVALTISDIRDWWVDYMENEIEPDGVVSLGTDAGTTAQRDSYRMLGAAETAIRNYYTDEVPGPYLPTVAAADDMSWRLRYTHTETTYCYGPDADEYVPWNEWFAGSTRVNRNERGGTLDLPPEEGIGYNMKEWLEDDVWPETGDPPFAILTHQDDNSTYDYEHWHTVPIYALLRSAAIFPATATYKTSGDTMGEDCRNNGTGEATWCMQDFADEIHPWLDSGNGTTIWPTYVVLYGHYVWGSTYYVGDNSLFPWGIRWTDDEEELQCVCMEAYYIDLQIDDDDPHPDRHGKALTRLASSSAANTVLLANRGVFARCMKTHNRGMRHECVATECGSTVPDAADLQTMFGTGNYLYSSMSSCITETTWLAYAHAGVALYIGCGSSGSNRQVYCTSSSHIYASELVSVNIDPGVFVLGGCSTACHPCASDSFVGMLVPAGAVAIMGAHKPNGSLDFPADNWLNSLDRRVGHYTEYVGGWEYYFVLGDPMVTLENIIFWCNTHDCDNDD